MTLDRETVAAIRAALESTADALAACCVDDTYEGAIAVSAAVARRARDALERLDEALAAPTAPATTRSRRLQ